MRRFLHQLANKIWYHSAVLGYLLLPFSYVYLLFFYLNRVLYRIGIKKTVSFNVPVIIIGNITVGGTGKTPLVIALSKFLQQQGFKPGIVSRGYGGRNIANPHIVTETSKASEVGDEALLLQQKTQVPVVVAKQRVQAVQKLITDFNCDIILSDDGLQHHALKRDIEIVVLDGERRLGNKFCLPAGPLREPVGRLKTVDFIVCNGNAAVNEYSMQLIPGKIYNLANALGDLTVNNADLHAVAAIGNPQRFFATLRQLGFEIIAHPFPDHAIFKPTDFHFGEKAAIIMTEKDAVKCRNFADQRFWCLPVNAQLDSNFLEKFLLKIKKINLKVRNAYGQNT